MFCILDTSTNLFQAVTDENGKAMLFDSIPEAEAYAKENIQSYTIVEVK